MFSEQSPPGRGRPHTPNCAIGSTRYVSGFELLTLKRAPGDCNLVGTPWLNLLQRFGTCPARDLSPCRCECGARWRSVQGRGGGERELLLEAGVPVSSSRGEVRLLGGKGSAVPFGALDPKCRFQRGGRKSDTDPLVLPRARASHTRRWNVFHCWQR